MTDKERFEEIAYNVGVSLDGEKALMSSDDYDFLYNYALQQAERVQELEEEVERYQSGRNVAVITKMKMDELEQQNKRYREAIEVAIHNIAASENLGVKFVLGILEQALESEENESHFPKRAEVSE